MDPKTNFRVVIVQTELERWKFLVRSFLRARIAKVGAWLPSVVSVLGYLSRYRASVCFVMLWMMQRMVHNPVLSFVCGLDRSLDAYNEFPQVFSSSSVNVDCA